MKLYTYPRLLMKPNGIVCLMLSFLGVCHLCEAQSVILEDVSRDLVKRERDYVLHKFDWRIENIKTFPGLMPKAIKKGQDGIREIESSEHVSVDRIKADLTSFQTLSNPRSVRFRNVWSVQTHDDQMVVTGETTDPPPTSYRTGISLLYAGHNATQIMNYVIRPDGTRMRPLEARAWRQRTEAFRYPNPMLVGLETRAEDYVFLAAKSPLLLYQAKWRLESTTESSWVLAATVPRPEEELSLHVTLSRVYNAAPVALTVQARGWSLKYRADKMKKMGTEWIATRIHSTFDAPHIVNQQRIWELADESGLDNLQLVKSGIMV